jgi:hypothetical protein
MSTLPHAIGWGAVPGVYDVTDLRHEDKQRVRKELEAQGFYVQEWFPADVVQVLVMAEVRERIAKEQEPTK